MTVPPPPAVPGELIEKAAKAIVGDYWHVGDDDREAVRAVLAAVYGDIVEAARRDALDQAAEAIRALDPHEAGDGDSFEWSAAVDEAARIVTDLRDATLRSAP